MHERHDLTDAEWALLEPLLPNRTPRRGGQWRDHRQVVNGVLWRTRTGAPWRDMPVTYGPWETVYYRHRRWSADGTWERILDRLRAGCDTDDGDGWTVGIDSTVVRAHHDAAGARHRPPVDVPADRLVDVLADATATSGHTGGPSNDKDRPADGHCVRDREAIGRSRGGLSTKLHLLADTRCRPLARVVTAGQRGDALGFTPLLDRLRIRRRGRGRPRTRPGVLLGDKAYSARRIRDHLRRRRIRTVIAEPADQTANRKRRGSAGGRPPAFDTDAYRARNTVERAIRKLNTHRAVAMRSDKRAYIYCGTIDVASMRIWLRDLTRHPPNTT